MPRLPAVGASWLALCLGALLHAGSAAEPFYLGAWKITAAAPAPWADPPNPDPAEMKTLAGKVILIKRGQIQGQAPLACKDPVYRLKDYPADWLFQGVFSEMHDRNKSADPAKLAASVGFRGSSWKTLITGCANEIEYHFVDATTAKFGLNDYIYTLQKQ